MTVIPEPKHEIPERLKVDNWAFHVLARSDDPAVKCLNIVNLVINIKETMMRAELMEEPYFDTMFNMNTTISRFLNYQLLGANKSINSYTNGKTGLAVEQANAVLSQVSGFIYDKRFTTAKSDSFTGVSK
jgi:hypothetical protein